MVIVWGSAYTSYTYSLDLGITEVYIPNCCPRYKRLLRYTPQDYVISTAVTWVAKFHAYNIVIPYHLPCVTKPLPLNQACLDAHVGLVQDSPDSINL
jgi:hypothetical protein